MNTVKAALLFCFRVFFKTRDGVLKTGDLVEIQLKTLWRFLLNAIASVFFAVLIAFIFVFFGASKTVGIVAGSLFLVYEFFNLFRNTPAPQDRYRRGRRIEPNEAPDEFP